MILLLPVALVGWFVYAWLNPGEPDPQLHPEPPPATTISEPTTPNREPAPDPNEDLARRKAECEALAELVVLARGTLEERVEAGYRWEQLGCQGYDFSE